MKIRNIIRLSVITLLTFFLAPSLWAQESRQGEKPREQITREIGGRTVSINLPTLMTPTEENFLKYKQDLQDIAQAQLDLGKALGVGSKVQDALDPLLKQMPTFKFSDMPPNYPGFPDLSGLKWVLVEEQRVIADLTAKIPKAKYAPTDDFPGPQYTLNLCPLNNPSGQPPEVAYASGLALIAFELVKFLAHDACEFTLLAFVYGGNFSIACIVSDVLYAGLKIAHYAIKWCDTDSLTGQIGGSVLRAEFIKDQLAFSIDNDNSNKAKLSTQLTNAQSHIVTNNNNNKASLSTQTSIFQNQAVRSSIERNMAADPATIAGVGLFQLPASRGGYLEVARQALIDTYNALVASAGAGVTIYNPSAELSLGASLTAQGKYREAYYYYRRGFRSMVKYP